MKRTSTGRRTVPIRALIYGDPGTGKTTFAASSPGALVLDLEHGSSHLDVARVEVDTFDEVLEVVRSTKTGTLVVDSLSKLEELVTDKILGVDRKPDANLVNYGKGYGEGWTMALQHWREFLAACDRCPASILMTAHALQKPYADPLGSSYDRWQVALNDKISATTQRFVDYTLFARFSNEQRKVDGRNVGISGERVLETSANAAWLAKHRGSIPDQLPMDWDAFAEAVEADRGTSEALRKSIAALIQEVTDTELAAKMHDALEAAGSDTVRLGAIQRRVEAKLNETKESA